MKAVAPDELLSQGKPVLAAVDLATGFAVSLKESEQRDKAAWTEILNEVKAQGLNPEVAVKDAGQAMLAAFNVVHRDCEQRDDCFHAQHRMTGSIERA